MMLLRWQTQAKLPTHITTTHALTRAYRIIRLALHILIGLATVSLIFPLIGATQKLKLIQWWHQSLLAILNITLMCYGAPSHALRHTLVLANHVSWLDIHALNSVLSLQFIAKADIRAWPIFGYLAKSAHVLFVDRTKRKDATRVIHIAAERLNEGSNLCLFPEGTTTDGTHVLPFKSSLVEAAMLANATILPVAIFYPKPDGSVNTDMAYAGETTMKQSLQRILQQQNSLIELHFLTPIATETLQDDVQHRREVTLKAEHEIKQKLGFALRH